MNQIDHKDQPGEYRAAVFAEVQRRLSFRGETPADPAFFLGDWVCRFARDSSEQSPPHCYRSFFPDGTAPARAADGAWSTPKDCWKLNEDRSFSLWSYVEAMPEYGIEQPTYSEDCYHVLMKNGEEFVLFNGDGSLVMVYARTKAQAPEA